MFLRFFILFFLCIKKYIGRKNSIKNLVIKNGIKQKVKYTIKMIKDIYNSKDALSVKRVAAKLFNCESVSLGTVIFRSAF